MALSIKKEELQGFCSYYSGCFGPGQHEICSFGLFALWFGREMAAGCVEHREHGAALTNLLANYRNDIKHTAPGKSLDTPFNGSCFVWFLLKILFVSENNNELSFLFTQFSGS